MIAAYQNVPFRPRVARSEGMVAVTATMDGEDHGFLLDIASAVDTAVAILGAVADLQEDDGFSHPVTGMHFEVVAPKFGEPEGRMTFELCGAPLIAHITPTQIAELAAAFARAADWVDKPAKRPRRDL
jgi:hypothetical protein